VRHPPAKDGASGDYCSKPSGNFVLLDGGDEFLITAVSMCRKLLGAILVALGSRYVSAEAVLNSCWCVVSSRL